MKHILLSAYIVISVLLLSACGGGSKTSSVITAGESVQFRYATLLKVVKNPDYTLVHIRNPWDTLRVLHTYILTDKQQPVPEQLPEGTVVRVPLEKLLVYSAVHASLLDELGALSHIGGICSREYFHHAGVQERCSAGTITDCGSSMSPDVERIIELTPDAIMLSPYESSGGYGQVGKLNIPLIECADYMETSPLGRAEWMRFYGMLVGKEAVADSLFSLVEKEYHEVSSKARRAEVKPVVISDLKYGSTWYISGGNSTTGRLYADAGATYVFASLKNSGSVPLSFETVFDKGQHADYWFVKYNQQTDKTYRELEQEFSLYARFKAFKERGIYGCNTHKVPFYEESPFHPELLLKDVVKVLHPTLLDGYELRYFSPLAVD